MRHHRYMVITMLILGLLLAGCSGANKENEAINAVSNVEKSVSELNSGAEASDKPEESSHPISFPESTDNIVDGVAVQLSIAPQFEDAGNFVDGLAPVKLNGKWGYIDKSGKAIIPPQYDTVYLFSEGLAAVGKNRKWGYVDTNGSLIIPLEYDGAGNFSEGLAAVRNQDNKWGYIDKKNKLVIPYQFEMALEREKPGEFHQGLAIFRSEEKEYDINLNGYIDKTGKVVIQPMFIAPTNFSEGYAGGIVDFTIQYVDTSGKIAINTGYNGYFGKFSEGLAAVMNESLWGFVDYSGELVITHQYDEALDFKDGLAAVKKDGKWGYIDRTGKTIIDFEYSMARSFSEGIALVANEEADYGYINKQGKPLSKFEFDFNSGSFSQGLARVHIAGKQDRYGFVSLVKAQAGTSQSDVTIKDDVAAFEGQWSTPGSDELAFKLSFADESSGTITYFFEGEEYPVPFGYVQPSNDRVLMRVGADEQERTTVTLVLTQGKLIYDEGGQKYNLEKYNIIEQSNTLEEASLLEGFKGKWCEDNQMLCFKIVFDANESGGYFDYYQEREPYQENFKLQYMDEYEMVIELEDHADQVRVVLSDDKQMITYITSFSSFTLNKE